MSPNTKRYNDAKCRNIARTITETIPWDKDRFFSIAKTEDGQIRRYGSSYAAVKAATKKAGGRNIQIYNAALKCRVY